MVSPTLRFWAALTMLAMLVTACADDAADAGAAPTEDSSDPRALSLMLNWTPNAHHVGIYAALAAGYYAEEGLDVTVVEPAMSGVEQAVASGAVQVGMAQAESLLPARAEGVPVRSIATVLPVNDSALYGLAEDGIERPRDLEGKRYGGFGGALETEIVSELVRCDGGDPDQVEMVEVGNVDYLAGLQADQFDVAWVFSGWDALRAEVVQDVEVSQIRFADYASCIPNWYTPLFLAAESTLAGDPALLEAFLAATARGYAAASMDPAAATEAMLVLVPELEPALLEAAVAYYAPRFVDQAGATSPASGRWGLQDEATWVSFADFLTEAGVARRAVDGAEAFTNDVLP